jgi:hypothetical protein
MHSRRKNPVQDSGFEMSRPMWVMRLAASHGNVPRSSAFTASEKKILSLESGPSLGDGRKRDSISIGGREEEAMDVRKLRLRGTLLSVPAALMSGGS